MIKSIYNKFLNIQYSPKRLFYLGLILIVLTTVLQLLAGWHEKGNFKIFISGTLDVCKDLNPYKDWNYQLDRFVYGPVFAIFFLPLALLPNWLGIFLWNIINYLLYFFGIQNLPEKVATQKNKKFMFFYLLPVLAHSAHSFQYNVSIAAFFLWGFIFLEKKRWTKGIAVIFFSAFTKIYGLVEIAMLLFYPKLKRNILLSISVFLAFLLLPLIALSPAKLMELYQSWFTLLGQRHDPTVFETIFRWLKFIGFTNVKDFVTHIQIGSVILIGIAILTSLKRCNDIKYRVGVLSILMSWVILFGTASETHTYIIALLGYLIWFIQKKRSKVEKILLWSNFVILTLTPMDIFCPVFIHEFLFKKLALNLFLFITTFGIIVYDVFFRKRRI